MRTSLDHLPAQKQRELAHIVQILFEEFEEGLSLASRDWKKAGRIVKVILYGSYARGTWVDEPHTAKGYKSDYDLLIIVNDQRLTDRVKYWAKLDDRLMRAYDISGTIRTPVNFIVHSLNEVTQGLSQGRYFFMDIAKDGIALYESENSDLPEPHPKTPQDAFALASEYYEEWYPSAQQFLIHGVEATKREWNKKAAFELHQATERLYHCVLLVCTFYSPHVHNLGFLRKQAERIDGRLSSIWPGDNKADRAMFEKLKDAYVKARYSKHYSISEDELTWLGARVEELSQAVELICTERLKQLEADIRQAG